MFTKTLRGLFLAGAILFAGANSPLSFEAAVLAKHNAERARLGLQPLHWSDELARGAEAWANHLAATGRFEHSPDEAGQPKIGENIWGGTAGRFGPERMVAGWISERQHFKPGVFPANSTTGEVEDVSHYTQIVWRSTRELGCAVARSRSEDILVCRYNSPGNVFGESPI